MAIDYLAVALTIAVTIATSIPLGRYIYPREGGTPLVVAEGARPLGVVHFKDIVKAASGSGSPTCERWASRRS